MHADHASFDPVVVSLSLGAAWTRQFRPRHVRPYGRDGLPSDEVIPPPVPPASCAVMRGERGCRASTAPTARTGPSKRSSSPSAYSAHVMPSTPAAASRFSAWKRAEPAGGDLGPRTGEDAVRRPGRRRKVLSANWIGPMPGASCGDQTRGSGSRCPSRINESKCSSIRLGTNESSIRRPSSMFLV